MKHITLSEAKARLSELVDELNDTGEAVTISGGELPTCVMMSAGVYGSLVETVEILCDSALVKRIEKALRQERSGKVFTHDEVWG